jgi:hypothetical protein
VVDWIDCDAGQVIRGATTGGGVGLTGVGVADCAHAEMSDAAQIEIEAARRQRSLTGKLNVVW